MPYALWLPQRGRANTGGNGDGRVFVTRLNIAPGWAWPMTVAQSKQRNEL
jgi:hypothetical protein